MTTDQKVLRSPEPEGSSTTLATAARSLLHNRDGAYSRELSLAPGGLGLGLVPEAQTPDATVPTVCGFCSTGCQLNVHMQQGKAVNLTPAVGHPVNLGQACPKGWESLEVLNSPDRATRPVIKNAAGRFEPVGWETALETFVGRFKTIQRQHGNDSVAFLSTGQIPTEEMALLGALTKFGMGVLHGDGNTRQCMASAAVAYKQSFGFDAPPYTYADFEQSDVIVLVGSNLCIAHPIMWERIMRNPHKPEIIVVDPRTTETAMQASQHLATRPKSDLTLFYGLAQTLIQKGWIDTDYVENHTNGFEEFAEHVAEFTPQRACRETGLSAEEFQKLAETIHNGRRVSFWWTMGVNQSHQGVRTAQSLINLALMTGNMGRPGTGANSITGQANAMGSRLFSNTTNLFGGRDFLDDDHRNCVAEILDIDAERIPSENSWAYNEVIEEILKGKIRGLWVIATNPAHSWINQSHFHDVIDRLDFLVVQDMYHNTETARIADLVLPAAGWGEKEGTFINSERRFGVLKKVAHAPGEALADFAIFKLVAHYWGCGEMFKEWKSPQAVFEILKHLSKGQPCDFSGIDGYEAIDEASGIQWPYPEAGGDDAMERRLFADGGFYHSDGRARFVFGQPRPLSEPPNERYPLLLLTGRGSVAQWHTQTRTKQSAVLRKLYSENTYVEINPADARRYAVQPNEWISVESQRGRIKAKAFITHTVKPGQVFIPMHYDHTNQLTDAVFDPESKQPSYKACAVRLRRKM